MLVSVKMIPPEIRAFLDCGAFIAMNLTVKHFHAI